MIRGKIVHSQHVLVQALRIRKKMTFSNRESIILPFISGRVITDYDPGFYLRVPPRARMLYMVGHNLFRRKRQHTIQYGFKGNLLTIYGFRIPILE